MCIRDSSTWTRRARSALPANQREQFDKVVIWRNRSAHEAVAKFMAADITRVRKLTASEEASLFNLLHSVPVDDRGTWLSSRRYDHWCRIPNVKLEKVLQGDQLQGIKEWLDRMSRLVFHRDRTG